MSFYLDLTLSARLPRWWWLSLLPAAPPSECIDTREASVLPPPELLLLSFWGRGRWDCPPSPVSTGELAVNFPPLISYSVHIRMKIFFIFCFTMATWFLSRFWSERSLILVWWCLLMLWSVLFWWPSARRCNLFCHLSKQQILGAQRNAVRFLLSAIQSAAKIFMYSLNFLY